MDFFEFFFREPGWLVRFVCLCILCKCIFPIIKRDTHYDINTDSDKSDKN